MKIFFISILSLVLSLGFSSCKKIEGTGGSSSIVGKIRAEVYDGAGNLLTAYDIAKEDVYIIYGGESTIFDDRFRTSYDGSFKFEFLEKGDYQIFVYSKDITLPSGKSVIIIDANISKNKSTIDLGTIVINK
tara:strand:- start:27538 stop:27933 length:396 start_codon:yes stop_codon:yes gene_type:complete